jgi:hypothetical protein
MAVLQEEALSATEEVELGRKARDGLVYHASQ